MDNKNSKSIKFQKVFSQLWNAGFFENVQLRTLYRKSARKMGKKHDSFREELKKKHHHIQFKSEDGLTIDGMVFNGGRSKVILFVPGIGSFYERIADQESVISHFYTFFETHFPDHASLVFNSRGIGESEGLFDLNALYLDTLGSYDFLLSQGYDIEDILLYTHSLGGLHAIQAAGIIQERFPDKHVSAINDRSLGEVKSFTKAFLKETAFGELAAKLIDKLGLNLSAKKAWESLKGQKLVIVSKYDRTIPYENGSFFHHVSEENVLHLEGNPKEKNHHTRPFKSHEAEKILSYFG